MARRRSDDLDRMLGARIREARGRRGLSLAQLGRAVGVTLQQFQKYESGETRLTVSTLIRIAEALDMDVDALIGGLGKEAARPGDAARLAGIDAARVSADRLIAQIGTISDPNTLGALEQIVVALCRTRRRKAQRAAELGHSRPAVPN